METEVNIIVVNIIHHKIQNVV